MSARKIAVIGGTGMNRWPGLEILREQRLDTPYGPPAAPLVHGRLAGTDVIFLARHGTGHKFPPHLINYRANLHALKQAGAQAIIAIAAVGGIARNFPPAAVAVPKDLIDYTYGRAHTFSDSHEADLQHVDFSAPYTPSLRKILLAAARKARVRVIDGGVMGVTQGPRLESPAEIRHLTKDGCTMVGMTSMPEAALARELSIDYTCMAVSVNWAAGLGSGDIHGEIEKSIADGMDKVQRILARAVTLL